MSMPYRSTLLACLATLTGCAFHTAKRSAVTSPDVSASTPGYAEVRTQVFEPLCFSCHSGGTKSGGDAFDTYEAAHAAATRIKAQVFALRKMPPSGTLSQSQADLLQAWLDGGAPEMAP